MIFDLSIHLRPARHLIISYDPAQAENDTLWKATTDELKENANSCRVGAVNVVNPASFK